MKKLSAAFFIAVLMSVATFAQKSDDKAAALASEKIASMLAAGSFAKANGSKTEFIKSLDEYLQRAAVFGFSGAVLIAKDNKILIHRGYGLSDREKGSSISTQTLFDIGSITKQFTAGAIMKLRETGKLSVEDKITRFFDNVPEDKREVTIHQLLTHTAGLPTYSGEDYALMSKDRFIVEVMKLPLRFKPDSRLAYSNVGYSLLALIIEKASNQQYEDFVYEQILRPAGMEKTGYVRPYWKKELVARGYNGLKDEGTPLDFAWYGDGPSWHLRGNGGFISTLDDLFRWHLALEKNKVLSESSKQMMISQKVPDGNSKSFYGYGWGISTTPRGTRVVSHSGSNGVFYANFRRYIDEGTVMIFATNDYRYDKGVGETVDAWYFGKEGVMPPKQAFEIPPPELNSYAGVYELPSGEKFTISVIGGQLTIDPQQPEIGLLLTKFPEINGKPRLRGVQQLVTEVITGIANRNFEPFRLILREETPFEGEKEFWGRAFGDWQERWGTFQDATVIGSTETTDAINTIVRVRFERGARSVGFIQNAKDKYFISANPPPFMPDLFRLVPLARSEFAVFNLQLSTGVPVNFQLNGGSVSGLTIQRENGDVFAKRGEL